MAQVKEIELPMNLNIDYVREILKQLENVNFMHLKNDVINIKIVKFEEPIRLFLVFGEHYTFDTHDEGGWDSILYVTDDIDDLAWFINGL